MPAPDDRAVLTRAIAASVSFRSGSVGIAGLAVAILAAFLWLLLGWFAEGDCVCSRLENLAGSTGPLVWFVILGLLFTRLVLSVAGRRIMQASARRITGGPPVSGEWSRALRQVDVDFCDVPIAVLTVPLLLAIVGAILLQLTRIPYLGPVLLVLLLPVFVILAFGIVRPIVRWLLSGHLIGASLALEPSTSFPAQSTAFAYLERAPLFVVGLRAGSIALALGAVLLRALTIALLGLALGWLAPGVATGGFGTVLVVLAGWWLASLFVSACWSARVAQYAILRRSLDGVELAGSADVEDPADLHEMGLELVKRLESEEE